MNNNIINISTKQINNYYSNTSDCISEYNRILNKIESFPEETNEDEDEFLQNFCIYLAHALIKDTGFGGKSRDELKRTAEIIIDVIE